MEIYRLRNELAAAIENRKWKTAKNRAKGILKLLPVALARKTSRTGADPHLEGVHSIGWQLLANAPEESRAVIIEMNGLIQSAKRKLGKTKNKKKK